MTDLKNALKVREMPQSYADMSYAERLWQDRQDEGGSVVMGRLEFVRYVEEAMKAQREACAKAFLKSLARFDYTCTATDIRCTVNIQLDNQYKAILEAEVQP